MSFVTATFPPVYDPARFDDFPVAPSGFRPFSFEIEAVGRLIEAVPMNPRRIKLLGIEIPVVHALLEPSDEYENYPAYFVAIGNLKRYWVWIWRQNMHIEVRPKTSWSKSERVAFPRTIEELTIELQLIIEDVRS